MFIDSIKKLDSKYYIVPIKSTVYLACGTKLLLNSTINRNSTLYIVLKAVHTFNFSSNSALNRKSTYS